MMKKIPILFKAQNGTHFIKVWEDPSEYFHPRDDTCIYCGEYLFTNPRFTCALDYKQKRAYYKEGSLCSPCFNTIRIAPLDEDINKLIKYLIKKGTKRAYLNP